MLGLPVTASPSTQTLREPVHTTRPVVAAAAPSKPRNVLQLQRNAAQMRLPAVRQTVARCSRGRSTLCKSSFSPARRLSGAIPAVGSISDNSSDVFLVNSWFDLPQVSPSLRQPYCIASSAALAEPPALERSAGDAAVSPAESQPPEAAVIRICEPEQLTEFIESHKQQLVVLMCKAHSCRPCKMFMRKYARIAQQYEDCGVCFLEIFGDDTKETRQLMMAMEIRVTPNFRLYRDGKLVHSLTGINETNLRKAVEEY